MSTVSDVAINVIDEDVDCPNIRVCQQNSENLPKINKIKRKDLTEEEKNSCELVQLRFWKMNSLPRDFRRLGILY